MEVFTEYVNHLLWDQVLEGFVGIWLFLGVFWRLVWIDVWSLCCVNGGFRCHVFAMFELKPGMTKGRIFVYVGVGG